MEKGDPMYPGPGSIEIEGRRWNYFPVTISRMGGPEGPVPISHSVSFVDPDDHDLRVEAWSVPVDEASLDEQGLRSIFRRAKHRGWKSDDGTLWHITLYRGIAVGARHQSGDAQVEPQPSLVVFEADVTEASYYAREFGIDSLGHMDDKLLQRLLASAKDG